uniref:Uncharacterized protein n=1 Tax=Tanacetum cinerariifolium TaxID=118510 RepID=A0A699S517_TANCI|nr:hypothetical protein [Tanacetum cinerariifolium]
MYIRRMWTMLNYFGKISFTRLTTKPTKSKRRCTTLNSPKLSFTTSLLKTKHSPRETRSGSKLDLELVPKEKRLEIRKCNERINPRKILREPTFQVILDALALTPCYSAFLITADVPEVYMHQF